MNCQNRTKHYNNLKDSIVIILSMGFALVCLIVPIVLASKGQIAESNDPRRVIIGTAISFGTICAILLYWIIGYCFGYYIIYDDRVFYRNLYTKKTIKFSNINKIEIKEEKAFVLGTYKNDVLTISDKKTNIKIYVYKKNREKILEFVDMLKKYVDA